MSLESTVIKIIKSLGFSGDKKVDITSLILSLFILATFIVFYPSLASKLWFLTIAVYFLFRLLLGEIVEIVVYFQQKMRREQNFYDAIDHLRDNERELLVRLLEINGKWYRIQSNANLNGRIVSLVEMELIESRPSSPTDQMEELDASLGANFLELKMTTACLRFLTKHNFKNAKNLNLIQ